MSRPNLWALELFWKHKLTFSEEFKKELREKIREIIEGADVPLDEDDESWIDDAVEENCKILRNYRPAVKKAR